jgi:hypothetical protein
MELPEAIDVLVEVRDNPEIDIITQEVREAARVALDAIEDGPTVEDLGEAADQLDAAQAVIDRVTEMCAGDGVVSMRDVRRALRGA